MLQMLMPISDLYQMQCRTRDSGLDNPLLLLRRTGSAGAMHLNHHGINRADGQDKLHLPRTISFCLLPQKLLASAIDGYRVTPGGSPRPGERAVAIALRL